MTPPTPPNRLQFKDGELTMKDGTDLQAYLREHLEEGDVVLVRRDYLDKLYAQAFYYRECGGACRFILAA